MKSNADMPRNRRVRAAQVASVGHAFYIRHRASCDNTHGRSTTSARSWKCKHNDIGSVFVGLLSGWVSIVLHGNPKINIPYIVYPHQDCLPAASQLCTEHCHHHRSTAMSALSSSEIFLT